MQKLTSFIALLGLFLLISNCTKDKNPLRSLEYFETKCSDPWKTNEGNTEEEIILALTDYLENELMVAFTSLNITFDTENAQTCKACHCTTGQKINIDVRQEFVEILEENGFILLELID